ncbi:MAG: YveK family protein [Chloroflexota bacterium]
MELRAYWAIVWRWRWLVLAIALITFAASLTIQTREPVTYSATVRLALNPNLPLPQSGNAAASEYYSPAQHYYYENIAAEYLNDDIMKITEGYTFRAAAIERATAALGRPVGGSIDSKKAHKLMLFTVTADDAQQAEALGKAVSDLLTDPRSEYVKPFVTYNPSISQVDPIRPEPAIPPSRAYLYMVLRVLLALVAGLGLAFLLEYLDDSVRGAREVEAAGLPVLAEIPAATGGRRAAPLTTPTGGKVRTA